MSIQISDKQYSHFVLVLFKQIRAHELLLKSERPGDLSISVQEEHDGGAFNQSLYY